MERGELARLLRQVRRGSLGVAAALERLRDWPAEDLGFVSIEHHRGLRQGQAEVVFCQGKRPAQVASIVGRLLAAGASVLATRAAPETFTAVRTEVPDARYNEVGLSILEEREGW